MSDVDSPKTPTGPTVVVCDDEELIRWSLCQHLEGLGYHCVPVDNGEACVEAVDAHHPAVVLLDLKMPVMDGLTALRTLRQRGLQLPVIVITAHGAIDSAIEATRLGASAYLAKPFDLREVALTVEKAMAHAKLRHEVDYLRARQHRGYGDFIGQSPALQPVYDVLRKLERVDVPNVLITGESGTGKDVIARMIHAKGRRSEGPFIEVDCASLPQELVESTLFGHVRGAFTDAKASKPGLFEVAKQGIVFLDEIGEMPLASQSKLLRAIENRTFRRVGGTSTMKMDTCIIAATNRDLQAEVNEGRFREDLFFRLNVVPITLPPLRERVDDLGLLVEHFVAQMNRTLGKHIRRVDERAIQQMQAYRWPGNVRELRNVIERFVLLSGDDECLETAHLPMEIRQSSAGEPQPSGVTLPAEGVQLESVERSLLMQALARVGGNQSQAARLLGITRYALRYRMKKYDLH